MNKEEKESVAHLEWLLDNGILSSEDEPYIQTVLDLIQKQEKIINKLDKENQGLFEAYNFNDTNLLAIILKEYKKELEQEKEKNKKLKEKQEFLEEGE